MSESPKLGWSFFLERLYIWGTAAAFTTISGFFVWVLTPVGEKVSSIWESPERVAEMQETLVRVEETLQDLSAEVAIARAPDQIVEYGPGTRFREDCSPGSSDCYLVLEVRRASPASLGCEIIPGATQRELISAEHGYTWEPELDFGSVRNLGPSYTLNEIRLRVPATIPPGRYFYRQTTYYTGCPWQNGGEPPVTSVSPMIPLELGEK